MARVQLRDLISEDTANVRDTQAFLVEKCVLLDEIQKLHLGYGFPQKGWGLNFRTKESLFQLLTRAGFSDIQIYDDANYPGKDDLPDDVLYGVETLPSQALGHDHNSKPMSLPSKEVLDENIGYNWIAVATK